MATIALAALATMALALLAPGAHAEGRCGSHPWCNTALTSGERAELLLAAMSQSDKVGILTGAEASDVGMPAIKFTDGAVGAGGVGSGIEGATAMPAAIGLAANFDQAMAQRYGTVVGVEVRHRGFDGDYGPTVNIMRTPIGGRTYEAYGEDPFLATQTAVSWIDGFQSQGVMADIKHFAANNQETDRMRISAQVDERTLREIYLPAFEHVVRAARPATVMCSYNRVNGVYASANRWLLTSVLRDEWGFDGYVVSDWGATRDPVAALRAGLDLEMPFSGGRSAAEIVAAIRGGELSEECLDLAIERQLGTHQRLRDSRGDEPAPDYDAHHALAKRAAAEGAVLLKNDGGLLPLDPASGGRIAVIGEFARTPRFQGGGSSKVNPTRLDDALTAIRAATAREIAFAPGFRLDGSPDAAAAAEAVDAARGAEAVLIFIGLPEQAESEGFDRTDLDLPAVQLDLLAAVAAVNPRVAVILSNGGVVVTGRVASQAAALLEIWLSGQAGGSAAADLVFGHAAPAGRLAETIPHRLADTPAYINWPGSEGQVHYGERVYIGYRWYDRTERRVAFPFGFGLAYTTFAYSDLVVEVPDPATPQAAVHVTVTNTGTRQGGDVVQVYVSAPAADGERPPRELRGFRKIRLAPGQSTRVLIGLDARAFSYWSTRHEQWVAGPGEYGIHVGSSSRDLPLAQRIRLDVAVPVSPLNEDSTLEEWYAHHRGRQIAADLFGKAMGAEDGRLEETSSWEFVSQMPVATLLKMSPGDGGQAAVDLADLLHAANDGQEAGTAEG